MSKLSPAGTGCTSAQPSLRDSSPARAIPHECWLEEICAEKARGVEPNFHAFYRWKDADADLPMLVAAKKEYAAL
jgi:hypothetical protein